MWVSPSPVPSLIWIIKDIYGGVGFNMTMETCWIIIRHHFDTGLDGCIGNRYEIYDLANMFSCLCHPYHYQFDYHDMMQIYLVMKPCREKIWVLIDCSVSSQIFCLWHVISQSFFLTVTILTFLNPFSLLCFQTWVLFSQNKIRKLYISISSRWYL